jgi:hypothetical protein
MACYLFAKKALLATGVMSARLAGGSADFAFSCRGVKVLGASTGDSVAWTGGEDGTLTVASDVLETDETDW